MNIKIVRKQGFLIEAGQGNPVIKFAVINTKGETVSPYFQCRDYVSDLCWGAYTGNGGKCHGFDFAPGEYKNLFDEGIFGITCKFVNSDKTVKITDEQFNGVKQAISLFNDAMAFPPVNITLSDDGENIIIFVSSAWTEVPYLQSALLLIMRLGFKYDPSQDFIKQFEDLKQQKFTSPFDASYFKVARWVLEDMLTGHIDTEQKYKPTDDIYLVHGQYGIVGYANSKKR